MNILSWIFFIIALIGYVISLIGSIVNNNDDESGNVTLCSLTNYLTIGLTFYGAINILSNNAIFILLWSMLGISILLSLYTIYKFIWDSYNVTAFYKIISIFFLCLLIATVIISFKIDISSTIVNPSINSTYKPAIPIIEIVLIIWIPLSVLLLIYWKIKNKQVLIDQKPNDRIEDIIYQLYMIYQDYEGNKPIDHVFDKFNMYMIHKEVNPETRLTILRNFEKLICKEIRRPIPINEFKNILLYGINNRYDEYNYTFENTYYLEVITERMQTILKREFSRNNRYKNMDNIQLHEINTNIEQLKDLLLQKDRTSNNKDFSGKDEDSSLQQQFIKELFHCLMTPISQVDDASLSTVKAKLSNIDRDEILERSLKSIQAGIKLTKSVLYAYRQVAYYTFNNVSEDTLTINDGVDSAELLYQSHSKKQLSFNNQNIPELIPGFSNYFILATLLPLLENAIYATESSQQISIEYEYIGQDHVFRISNPCQNSINIKNLYKDGFSSKNEKGKQHKGTGLAIVRNLIGKIDHSKLEFELNNNILTAVLKIHNNEIQDRNTSN